MSSGAEPSDQPGMSATLRDNIARLRDRTDRDARSAPWSVRLADRITTVTGSMGFVAAHALAYALWIIANLGWLPGVPRFDPSFVILAMEASVEAIFLSTFVLISQNRQAALSERRAELDLHINLLAEHELTKLAILVERIADRVGVAERDPDFHEVRRNVAPEQVLDALEKTASTSGG